MPAQQQVSLPSAGPSQLPRVIPSVGQVPKAYTFSQPESELTRPPIRSNTDPPATLVYGQVQSIQRRQVRQAQDTAVRLRDLTLIRTIPQRWTRPMDPVVRYGFAVFRNSPEAPTLGRFFGQAIQKRVFSPSMETCPGFTC